MNRHQRRLAARNESKASNAAAASTAASSTAASSPTVDLPPVKASWVARLAAWLLLSRWVLARARHPTARAALAILAREVGRNDLADGLER